MNHCVPDFDMDDDFNLPPTATSSSGLTRNKKSAMAEEDIMELLWQNGQVVVHSQNHRSLHKSNNFSDDAAIPAEQDAAREIRPAAAGDATAANQHVFMQEDEMASWLHYPLDEPSFDDRDLYSDLLYPTASSAPVYAAAPPPPLREIRSAIAEIRQAPMHQPPTPRPPIPPAKRTDLKPAPPRLQNFGLFSRLPRARVEPAGPSSSIKAARESTTVVDSNDTPVVGTESRVSRVAESKVLISGGNVGCGTVSSAVATATATTSASNREMMTCEQSVTSSPGGSGASASAEPPQKTVPTAADDRKRKGIETDEMEGHSEDIESADAKKQARGSASIKRSRAAEVHNLSERRRRDRINEKMRALQELIPRCNKSDKASMLDDAIEYLKSLQLQVQMMSMGCGMLPMMYPGMQQYMPAMGMSMSMGMCMEMGMNRAMVPYPLLPGSSMPSATAAAQMSQRFPMPPPFPMPPVPVPDPSRVQTSNQPDPMLNPLVANPTQQQLPNFADPYQQFFGLHQAQVTLPLNQTVEHPIKNKPSSSKDVGNPRNHQPS